MIYALLLSVTNLARPDLDETTDLADTADIPGAVPALCAKLVEKYALGGGTDREIAERFLVDEKQLRDRYGEVLRVARALRQLTLRSHQFSVACKGNPSMLTWLGRNELGQSLNPNQPGEAEPEMEEKAG